MRVFKWSWAVIGVLAWVPACSGRYTSSPTGGEGQQQLIACDTYASCGVDTPCPGGTCVSVVGCSSAICIDSADVCEQACGERDCPVLESYPAQVPSCPDGTPIRGTGDAQAPLGHGGSGPVPPIGPPGGWGGSLNADNQYGYAPLVGELGDGRVNCSVFQRCDFDVGCPGNVAPCVQIPNCGAGVCLLPQNLCNEECSGSCSIVHGQTVTVECSTGLTGYEQYGGTGGTGNVLQPLGGSAGVGVGGISCGAPSF